MLPVFCHLLKKIGIDLGNEVNATHPIFATEHGFPIRPTDVGTQKIDGTTLDIYGMVVAAFLLTDRTNKIKFFEKTFLIANVSPKIVLGIPFRALTSVDVNSYMHNRVCM